MIWEFDRLPQNLQDQYVQNGYIVKPDIGVMDEYYQVSNIDYAWKKVYSYGKEHYPWNDTNRGEHEDIIRLHRWQQGEKGKTLSQLVELERRRKVRFVAEFLRNANESVKRRVLEEVCYRFSVSMLYNAIIRLTNNGTIIYKYGNT